MRKRLDDALVARGLAPTRSRARDFILRGMVQVGGIVAKKPAMLVGPDDPLDMAPHAGMHYVSRGALKLAAALDAFGFDPAGRIALDAGASTGGFTQVLLERGACRVHAVDVGHGQFHATLQTHPGVVLHERTDVRTLNAICLDHPVTAIVADVSFISLTKVLPTLVELAAPGAWLVALVKPQFEVGADAVGKGGIVKDEAARMRAVEKIATFISERPGWTVAGIIPSPIAGGSGNVEFLLGASFDG